METENYYIGLITLETRNAFNIGFNFHICNNCSNISIAIFTVQLTLIFHMKKNR